MDKEAQFKNTSIRLMREMHQRYEVCRGDNQVMFAAIGNLAHECGGFRLMEEGSPTVKGSLGGISFAQWTGMGKTGRRRLFMEFCRRNRLHPYSYEAGCNFFIHELDASRSILKAVSAALTDHHKTALRAKVERFEMLYERAGVKHYDSREQYALKAANVWREWNEAGKPEPGPYIMPTARFSQKFDAEFGSGESAITKREVPYVEPPVGKPPRPARPKPAPVTSAETKPIPTVAPPPPPPPLTKAEIEAVQQRLRDKGFVSVGRVDGKAGVKFTGALAAFQAKAGLGVTGTYTPETRAALMADDAPAAVVSDDRARATKGALIAVGEPTVKNADTIQKTGIGTAVGGLATSAAIGAAQYAGDAWTIMKDMREDFASVPLWVWPLVVVAIALFLAWRAGKIVSVRVGEERAGTNTSIAVPLPEDKLAPPPPQPIGEALADLDRRVPPADLRPQPGWEKEPV